MSANLCVLQGRLTSEPDLKYTSSQTPVISFTMAVDRDYKKDGQKVTDFINCVAWRGIAETISKYFHKGTAAVVFGRLEINGYTSPGGEKHFPAQVNVAHIYFGESKKFAQGGSQSFTETNEDGNPFEPEPYANTIPDYSNYEGGEDEIPY